MNDEIDPSCIYHGKCANCGRLISEHNNPELPVSGKYRKYNGYSKNLLACEESGGYKVRSGDVYATATVSARRQLTGIYDPLHNDPRVQELAERILDVMKR